jgi:hypothetical protein
MSFISFNYLGLDSAITGGLLIGMGPGLSDLFSSMGSLAGLGALGTILPILIQGILGLMAVMIFPLHWLLYFRPDEPIFAFALILPWVLTAFLTSLLFAKSMKEGFMMPIVLGITLIVIILAVFQGLLPALASNMGGTDVTGLLDAVFQGLAGLPEGLPLSDLSAQWIMILAILEGSLVGSAFGAFAGAIRYNPKTPGYEPKSEPAMI